MFDITQKFKLDIPSRGTITLSPSDYVTSGGEGHVYRKDKLAIKIWHDSADAARRRMPDRINRLGSLPDTFIAKPQSLVTLKSVAVGYVMPWVNGWGLPLAFTSGWRTANSFDNDAAINFLRLMRDVVAATHKDNITLGDANEFNILGVGKDPVYIDVDSWVPEGFAGDKVLPTIFDHHSTPFSKDADWFAWAVVGFQLLTGVHPYRGSHPNFAKNDLAGRMKGNVSVFSPDVKVPPAMRPMNVVPADLRSWFEQVFQGGCRTEPKDFTYQVTSVGVPIAFAAPSTGRATLTELYALKVPVARNVAPGLLLLTNGDLVDIHSGRRFGTVSSPDQSFVALDSALIAAMPRQEGVNDITIAGLAGNTTLSSMINVVSSWSVANKLYAVMHDGLLELLPREMKNETKFLPGRRWALNPNATQFGDGMAVYNALGAKFVVVPHDDGLSFMRTPHLDSLTVLAMVRRGRIAVLVVADKQGAYHRLIGVFSDGYTRVTWAQEDVHGPDLSDVITDQGIVVRILANGQLELTQPLGTATPIVTDFPAGARLFSGPAGVYAAMGDKMLKVGLK